MKYFMLLLLVFAQTSWAEGDGGGGRPYVMQPPLHLQERFQFQTTVLLDRENFGRLQMALLDLKNLIPRLARHVGYDVNVAFSVDHLPAGARVLIAIEGSGDEMLRFFDLFLNGNIAPLIHILKAGSWLRPPDKYRKHWEEAYADIQREVETQALSHWTIKQKETTLANFCEPMMKAQEQRGTL